MPCCRSATLALRLCAFVHMLWIVMAITSGIATASICTPYPVAPRNCCNFAKNISCCRDWSQWQTTMGKSCPVSHPTLDSISIAQNEHELGFKWSVASTQNIIGYRLLLSCSWQNRDDSANGSALGETKSASECFEVNRKDSTDVSVTPHACKERFSWLPVNCLHSTIFSEFYHSAHQDDTAQCTLSISSLPLSDTTAVPVKRFALSSCRQRGCPPHTFEFVHTCDEDHRAKQLGYFKGNNYRYSSIRLCDCDIRKPSAVSFSNGALQWSEPKDMIFTASGQYDIMYWREDIGYAYQPAVWCNATKRRCHMNTSTIPVSNSKAVQQALGIMANSEMPRVTISGYFWVQVIPPDKSPTPTTTSTQATQATSEKATDPNGGDNRASSHPFFSSSPPKRFFVPIGGRTSSQSQSSTPGAKHESPRKNDDLLVVILVVVVVLCICVAASIFARRACRQSVTETGTHKASHASSHHDRRTPDSDGKSVTSSEAMSEASECIKYPVDTLDSRQFDLIPDPGHPIPDVFISFARYPNSNEDAVMKLALRLRRCGLIVAIASPDLHLHPDDEFCENVPDWIRRQMDACRYVLVVISRFYPHCRNDSPTAALPPALAFAPAPTPAISPPPVWSEHAPISTTSYNCHKEGETQKEEVAMSDNVKDCFGRGDLDIDNNDRRLNEILRRTEANRQMMQQEARRVVADRQLSSGSLAMVDRFAAMECRHINGMMLDDERVKDIIPVYLDTAALRVKLPAYLEPCVRYFANAPAAIPAALRDMTMDLDALVTRLTPGPAS